MGAVVDYRDGGDRGMRLCSDQDERRVILTREADAPAPAEAEPA
jgi:hypothetical protein